jgi:hypothetical protein
LPRSGGGIYSKGSPSVVSGTTIQSAAYNTTIDDLVTDANAARPISAGGTGAANAADARTNLGGTATGVAVFTAADAAAARTAISISATNTPFTPAGNIAATDVQAALAELDSEKAALAGATFTGGINGTTGAFSGVVSGAAASADGHLLNRITADVRHLGDTYRNRIINPGMQISQERGTTLVDVTNGGAYTVDQWQVGLSTTPGGTLRAQQVASVTPAGSPFRLRHTAQVADASIAATDTYAIGQFIEGQMIADARLGTASARQIVVRFGVRSSLAGTFGVRLANSPLNRSYVTTITIAGGEINTDLVRTVVIPGDTTGTWLTDTGIGVFLQITLAAGTTLQTTAGSWQAGNFLTTSAQTNFMGTAGDTFELFDVGLYVDALAIGAAPSWELPAWDADLLACQRYYWRGLPAVALNFSAYADNAIMSWPVMFPTTMRTEPVLTSSTSGATFGNCDGFTWSQPTKDGGRVLLSATAINLNALVTFAAANFLAANARF